MLKHLVCGQRIGIDVNDSAREAAKANGVKAVAAVADVEDGWADVLISNNALEHVTNPFEILQRLKPKVKKGGKIIFVLPHEKRNPYRAGDMNRHLFTWSPMCAGNLFSAAGFQVKKVETIDHIWPPVGYYQIRRYFGLTAFRCVSWLYTRLLSSWTLVRVEASNE